MPIPIASQATLNEFRGMLIDWYREHARDYPWRETTDPYRILVCEVMSQQTQLDRIVEPWSAFIDRWPNIEALAEADRSAVIGFWTDHRLGYNNRAKYLHQTANEVVDSHDGALPRSVSALESLPGIGPYTANAIASFAFNSGNAVVDTNVKRVLYRLDEGDEEPDYRSVADRILPEGRSRVWNNAIMELGGTTCQKSPKCDDMSCPWRRWCSAYKSGDFTAPDVPTQPSFEGSRRQYRGQIIRILSEVDTITVDELGPRVRMDYCHDGHPGRDWLLDILSDLGDDGLIDINTGNPVTVSLQS